MKYPSLYIQNQMRCFKMGRDPEIKELRIGKKRTFNNHKDLKYEIYRIMLEKAGLK